MTRFPFHCLYVTSPLSLLPALLLPRLLTVMMTFLFCVSHAVLLCFRVMSMLWFLSSSQCFSPFPPPPPLLFALNLPRRLAAADDALSGMVNTNLLVLLLLLLLHH
jgi:hypothetical protein